MPQLSGQVQYPARFDTRPQPVKNQVSRAERESAMNVWKWYHGYVLGLWVAIPLAPAQTSQIGREVAIQQHLRNGQEFEISLSTLLDIGKEIFAANWTVQDGQGRPLAKGVGT